MYVTACIKQEEIYAFLEHISSPCYHGQYCIMYICISIKNSNSKKIRKAPLAFSRNLSIIITKYKYGTNCFTVEGKYGVQQRAGI